LNILIKYFVHNFNMSEEASSRFWTITKKESMLGKLLTHQTFSTAKITKICLLLSILFSNTQSNIAKSSLRFKKIKA
jgi:hypothetical protein